MTFDNMPVGATIQTVPDGIWKDEKSNEWCRISLVIRPSIDKGGDYESFNLQTFPLEFIQKISSLEVVAGTNSNASDISGATIEVLSSNGLKRIELRKLAAQDEILEKWSERANLVWQHIFDSSCGSTDFKQLCDALKSVEENNSDSTSYVTSSNQDNVFRPPQISGNIPFMEEDWLVNGLFSESFNSCVNLAKFAALSSPEFKRFASCLSDLFLEFSDDMPIATPEGTLAAMQADDNGNGGKKDDDNEIDFGRVLRTKSGAPKDELDPLYDGERRLLTAEFSSILGMVDESIKKKNKTYFDSAAELDKTVTDISNGNPYELNSSLFQELNNEPFDPSSKIDFEYLKQFEIQSLVEALEFSTSEKYDFEEVKKRYKSGSPYLFSLAKLLLATRDPRTPLVRNEEDGNHPNRATPNEQWKDDPALRRMTGIGSYPRLAKFLGLTLDIDIPINKLSSSADTPNYIWATLGKGQYHKTKTAYKLNQNYFGPVDAGEIVSNSISSNSRSDNNYIDGFYNLQKRRGDYFGVGIVSQHKSSRFVLRSLQDQMAVNSMKLMAHQVKNEKSYDENESAIDNDTSSPRSYGIALIDREAMHDQKRGAVNGFFHLQYQNTDRIPFLLDDVKDGYRFDIGEIEMGGENKDIKWRSASEREIILPTEIEEFLPGEYIRKNRRFRKANEPWLVDRDSGYVQTASRIMKSDTPPKAGTSESKYFAVARTELQTFMGRSFALPSQSQLVKLSKDELPIAMKTQRAPMYVPGPGSFKVPNEEPDLYFGNSYLFACRIALITGGGLSWREAYEKFYSKKEFYESADKALTHPWIIGGENGKAFRFLRPDPIQPPDLHWALVPDNMPAGTGEQLKVLLRRSGDGAFQNPPTYRVITPPRVFQEMLKLHKVFGDADVDNITTPGAFRNLKLTEKSGRFPTIGDENNTDDISPNDAPDKQQEIYKVGDTVAIPLKRKYEPEAPYYTDPLAQQFVIAICDHGDELQHMKDIKFFQVYPKSNQPVPTEASPFLLQLDYESENEELKIEIDDWEDRPRKWRNAVAGRVTVHLPKAAHVDIWLWCSPDSRLSENMNATAGTMKGFDDIQSILNRGSDNKRFSGKSFSLFRKLVTSVNSKNSQFSAASNSHQKLDKLRQKSLEFCKSTSSDSFHKFSNDGPCLPLPGIAREVKLTAIHAVQRPCKPPVLETIALVRLDINQISSNDHDALIKIWGQYVKKKAESMPSVPVGDGWESEIDGTIAFIAGKVSFDRKSTEKIKAFGYWANFPTRATKNEAGVYACTPKVTVDELGVIDNIDVSGKELLGKEYFHRHENNNSLRTLFFNYGDHKARKIILTMEAYSVFSSHFPELKTEPDKGSAIDNTLASQRGLEGLPFQTDWSVELFDYVVADESNLSPFVKRSIHNREILFKATARPQKPLARIETVPVNADVSSTDYDNNIVTTVRESAVRIHLGKEWFSAGEGEQLAVICGPSEWWVDKSEKIRKNPKKGVVDLNSLGPLEPYCTRWGADPTLVSGRIEEVISLERYREDFNSKKIGQKIKMPITSLQLTLDANEDSEKNDSGSSKNQTYTVLAQIYTPQIDTKNGEFYCDIPIKQGNSYFPLIRFGLARYQHNSLEGLELSIPISKNWSQLSPKRTVQVQHHKKNNEYTVVIKGVGYTKKNSTLNESYDDLIDRPHISIEIMEETFNSNGEPKGAVPVKSASGLEHGYKCDCVAPRVESKFWKRGALDEPEMIWQFDHIKIPKAESQTTRRFLLITETSFYASDSQIETSRTCSELGKMDTMIMRAEIDTPPK